MLFAPQDNDHDDLITVCEACLKASCWQGDLCLKAKEGTIPGIQKSRSELVALNLEDPSFWISDKEFNETFDPYIGLFS